MSNDSELESLQCYPFHLPEKWDVFVDGTPIDFYGVFGVSHDMLQFEPLGSIGLEAHTWNTMSDAQVVKDLLEAAGVPEDEEETEGFGIVSQGSLLVYPISGSTYWSLDSGLTFSVATGQESERIRELIMSDVDQLVSFLKTLEGRDNGTE
jgi:hypothetical protein